MKKPAKSINIPRNLLKKKLNKESKLVSATSLEVLREMENLEIMESRTSEPSISYEKLLKKLKRSKKI